MRAYVFPGQAAQFEGMGKDLYESSDVARQLFHQADDILGYKLSEIMFHGSAEELKETRITQPAVFLHSIVKAKMAGVEFKPQMIAGHSLGEFSALVAADGLSFEEGLKLVQIRAEAMQKACEITPSTMAAIIGLEDAILEEICASIDDIVVPANYNCPGQLVISGTISGVDAAVAKAKEAGARTAVVLQVGGAFHSPLMEPAREELEKALKSANIAIPSCPIYQNVDAFAYLEPEIIRRNLINQLTSPVRWTQIMQNMIADGASQFIEVGGTGKVIRGFIARIDRQMPTETL
ncbi:MAG: ACP S-malonyltransferase [Saprospiraceae bacterium]|nr:ACP S-malonyltransferase [Saprospiraceae bacterium]